jgi:hypothetical protein
MVQSCKNVDLRRKPQGEYKPLHVDKMMHKVAHMDEP